MLRFSCTYSDDRPPLTELHGAHLLGADNVPVRGSVNLVDNEIVCDCRTDEPIALSLLWTVPGFGVCQLQTTRLPSSDKPYILQLELARHRLMSINVKREEWGLFDYPGMAEITKDIEAARDAFIAALQAADNPKSVREFADGALRLSLLASERMSQFHASVFLSRRQQIRGLSHQFLGVSVPSSDSRTDLVQQVSGKFDFARIPFVWRDIQPKEHGSNYDTIDRWIQACKEAKLTLHGGPLLNMGVSSLPDWMYIWENDFDTVLEMARDHVTRTVKRYGKDISTWIVCSGLHANDALSLNFENIIELTRMAATTTRKAAPRSQLVIDLTQPWGEYFARNPRTIPPLLYAEMIAQSGIPFDAFGLQFLYGINSDGYHLRDLMQISSLIDRLANLGKPMHITALSAPSQGGDPHDGTPTGGLWREPWSDDVQAGWLRAFIEIALSRPYVESVCVQTLADDIGDGFPACGLYTKDLKPKPALQQLCDLRKDLKNEPSK